MKSSVPTDNPDDVARYNVRVRGPIGEFMAFEHALLDKLFAQAARGSIEAYQSFRQHLLRHIRIEERLLLPMAEGKRGGKPLPLAARLRLDHGALAALMMLPPTARAFKAVKTVLESHNPLEETPGGIYDQCETLAGPEYGELLLQCEKRPPVPVSLWNDDSRVFQAARRALIRAGYAASLLENESEPE
jgi:hypothetical protein